MIEVVGGTGSSFQLLSFPLPSGSNLGKRVIKNGLMCNDVTVTSKINLQTNTDEAGIVVGFQDVGNHIDITVSPYWDEMVIWSWVNNQMTAIAGTGHGGVVVNTNQDYWLKAVLRVDGSIEGYWSTDGTNFTRKVFSTVSGTVLGGVGYATNGYSPPHTHFDDFNVSQ